MTELETFVKELTEHWNACGEARRKPRRVWSTLKPQERPIQLKAALLQFPTATLPELADMVRCTRSTAKLFAVTYPEALWEAKETLWRNERATGNNQLKRLYRRCWLWNVTLPGIVRGGVTVRCAGK